MSEPSSTIRLGNVPFSIPSAGNIHTLEIWGSRGAQASGMMSLLDKKVMSNAYFIRPDRGTVQLDCNANEIYGVNYCMFRNNAPAANFGGRWWYAFVTQVEYINEEVCRVYFTIDDLQTWRFDYDLTECYVEREHADDDTVGANILDEPLDTGELVYNSLNVYDSIKHMAIAVFSAMEPDMSDAAGATKSNSIGGWIDNLYCGCGLYLFTNGEDAGNWLVKLNDQGGGEAISGIYLIPAYLYPSNWPANNGQNVFTAFEKAATQQRDWPPLSDTSADTAYNIDGYTPRNNKLCTYPFNFMRILNFTGQYHDYRFEFFTSPRQPVYRVRMAAVPGGDIVLYPRGYNGVDFNAAEMFNLGGLTQLAWSYNSFANWQAQNQGAQVTSVLTGGLMIAAGAVAFGLTYGAAAPLSAGMASTGAGMAAMAMGAGAGSMVGGASTILNTAGQYMTASQAASKMMGQNSNTTLTTIGYNSFAGAHLSVRNQIARIIDEFFDAFGYTTQRVKVPNRTGRPSWNYVKTRNCPFNGNVPSDAMERIKSYFDNGITFWHTTDVGNYSLANK